MIISEGLDHDFVLYSDKNGINTINVTGVSVYPGTVYITILEHNKVLEYFHHVPCGIALNGTFQCNIYIFL